MSLKTKLLFFNIPAYGHVNPSLPVVSELARRGQQVIYYNAENFAPVVQGSGVEFRTYPDSAASEAELAQRSSNLVTVTAWIMEESLRLLPFCMEAIQQEQPDLVMFDSLALWGMAAARRLDVPHACSIVTAVNDGVPGLIRPRDFLHIIRHSLTSLPGLQRLRGELVRRYGAGIFPGKSILPCRGELNIVYTSRQFQPETPYIDESFHFVGPSILPASRQPVAFPWERLEPGRTKVYLSLGTLYNQHPVFYRAVLAAFAGHPAQLILSVGRATDIAGLGPIPENCIVLSSVPQLELLEKVDLFITHGGMNSVNEGLNQGLPLVVVPQQIEQAFNGRLVARHGAGVVLADAPPYGRVAGGALRRALDQVLADPAYRKNAERLRRSFREAGGYRRAAEVVLSRLGG